jgi:hypothetical protein
MYIQTTTMLQTSILYFMRQGHEDNPTLTLFYRQILGVEGKVPG